MLHSNYFNKIFDFMDNIIKENDLKVTNYILLLDWNNSEANVVVCFKNNDNDLKNKIGAYGHTIDYFIAYPIPYDLLTVSVSFLTEFLSYDPSFLDNRGISCSNHLLWEELVKNDKIQQQIDDYLLEKAENAY